MEPTLTESDAPSPESLAVALGRLAPARLLFVRRDLAQLDPQLHAELVKLLARSSDPGKRADNVEYVLLLMHQARELDSQRYLREVFLPWGAMRRRTDLHRARLGQEFGRLDQFEANSDEDVLHAVNLYRSIVSDLFDPYLTLLVASYQFIEGTFSDISTANLEAGERNKVEYLTKRIRDHGGPQTLLEGYDPVVRNALSHTGSDGLVFERGAVLFRNIKRQSPVAVETVRWRHDELQLRVIALVEFLWSLDASAQVFGIDCSDLFDAD
jgi:hypothetical protein